VEAGHDIDGEDEHGGVLDGGLDLPLHAEFDFAVRRVLVDVADTAGVDELEPFVEPRGLGGQPVARHPLLLVHDGKPFAGDAVEERRLADIGSADDGDDARTGRGTGVESLDMRVL
jgi:hypothetical protein